MVACFQHPDGILYFRPFWDQLHDGEGIQIVTGEIKGEGPWKVGDAVVINVTPEQIVSRQAKTSALASPPEAPVLDGVDMKPGSPSKAQRPSWLTKTRLDYKE